MRRIIGRSMRRGSRGKIMMGQDEEEEDEEQEEEEEYEEYQ